MFTRKCGTCAQDKPLISFGLKSKDPVKYHYTCLECVAVYLKNRKSELKASSGGCIVSRCRFSAEDTMCARHTLRWSYISTFTKVVQTGDEWYHLLGSAGTKGPDGYIKIKFSSHPNSKLHGALPEHTLVMTYMVGRALFPGENVHHKNGVRDDNRPENLELWSKSQPAGQRIDDKVNWAIELLSVYKPEVLINGVR
jgi:hypothetical protein